MKRHRAADSNASIPEHKRRRTAVRQLSDLSDELQIQVLLHLDSASQLARLSQVSAHFKRLADDPLVWKNLFFRHFSNDTGDLSSNNSDLRHDRRGRTEQQSQWKALYRLQTNWKDGQASSSYVLRHAVLADPPADLIATPAADATSTSISAPQTFGAQSIVQFSGQYVFAASRLPFHAVPSISLHRLGSGQQGTHQEIDSFQPPSLVAYYAERPHLLNARPLSMTEMRLDEGQQSMPNLFRLAVFYSSGQFCLLRLSLDDSQRSLGVVEEHVHLDVPLDTRPDPILDARFHLPLLVTVSERFVLRYHHVVLNKISGNLELFLNQTSMQSAFCCRPLTLNLFRTSKSKFRANIVYSTPWFPSSFTVGLQEFLVRLPAADDPTGQLTIQTQAATAVPLAETARPKPLVTGLDLHDSFVVASREDNTIDLFEIIRPKAGAMRLEHRKRLFSHTCAVHSVSFDGSRCVSGARDGSLKVWHLLQQQQQQQQQRERPTAKHRVRGYQSVGRPSYQEVVAVTEPQEGDDDAVMEHKPMRDLQWREEWSTRAASGAVDWVAFDTDKIVLSTPESIKILSFR